MRALALFLFFAAACGCPDGQKSYQVHGDFDQRATYVCIPDPEPASKSGATTASSCASADAGTSDVTLTSSADPPPTLRGVTPPDGTFTLARAVRYSPDEARPPLVFRAVLVRAGAKLVLGTQADGSNESFLLTLAAGTLVDVCETRYGKAVGSALLPDGVGGTTPADLDWNDATHTLTLSIHAGTATIAMEFVT